MKAILLTRFGSPQSAFEIREIPQPTVKEGEVLIKVEAFGLNYADVLARQGLYADTPKLPCVLGFEVVGVIDRLGPNVTRWQEGQRVMAFTRFGGYAEYAATSAQGLSEIATTTDATVATALATQYVTAYYCAEVATKLFPGDHVLIQAAAGGVGTALIQLAKRHNCVVYGTAGSAEKLEYLRKQGVDHPINYNEQDFEVAIENIRGKRGIDVIFDSLGGAAVQKGMKMLEQGGRMICLGATTLSGGKGNPLKMARVGIGFGFYSPIPLLTHSKSLIGVNMLRIADHRPHVLQHCLYEVNRLYNSGVLHPVVGKVFEANDIAAAHEYLSSRNSVGKVAVRW